MRTLVMALLMVSLSSCLKTRSELRGESSSTAEPTRNTIGGSGAGQAQQRAQIDSRFYEIDQDFRQLYGKMEALEKELQDLKEEKDQVSPQASKGDSEGLKKLEKRMSTLEEAILSLDKKLSEMSQTNSALSPKNIKLPFARGEAYFARGNYEKAIESFDEYRKRFPKGEKYAEATLKMGLSFNKLKMNQDAKAFFQEVIQRYPETAVANQAQANLKSL